MKLLVIILCLFSERYLIHGISHERFTWFSSYQDKVAKYAAKYKFTDSLWVNWILLIMPLIILTAIVLYLFQSLLWGLLGFLLHLFIFYYCIGPDNAFYPPAAELIKRGENPAKSYFERVNGQLFSPIFWYLLLGPLMVLFYRMNSVASGRKQIAPLCSKISSILEWLPARLTALSYLLAGNFQGGFFVFKKYAGSNLDSSTVLLGETGVAAVGNTDEPVSLPQAESLVEQSLIIYLAGFSVFIIATWL